MVDLALLNNELFQHAAEISAARKAKNTVEAYESDWRQFQTWCDGYKIESLPASEHCVSLFVTDLSHKGAKYATIARKITAINQKHLAEGHIRPGKRILREVLQGIRRLRGTAQRKAKPITWPILQRIIAETKNSRLGTRDRALLLIGFSGALRRSELVAIDLEDIEFLEEGMVINQKHSKTNQEGELRKIAIPFIDSPGMCPVRALRAHIEESSIKEGALFRRRDLRLASRGVSIIIKKYVEKLGFDPADFSGHSLRAGFATSATQAGVRSAAIMSRTGHKSFSVFSGYVREGTLFVEHPLIEIVNRFSLKSTTT